jgi:hypothetical protein
MPGVLDRVRRWIGRAEQPHCDTCAFVEFFRSNGDGQVSRIHAYCRCPGGAHQGHPVPSIRRCERWQRAAGEIEKPSVGDPTLTV